jgi:hypothetical protein
LKKRTNIVDGEDGVKKEDDNSDIYPVSKIDLNRSLDKYIQAKVF